MKNPTLPLAALAALAATALIASDTAANWENHCMSCHGGDGRGETKMGRKLKVRSLADPAVQAQFTDEQAARAIKEGVKDDKGKTQMKPIEGLSDAEVAALVAYVRSLKQ